MTGRTRPLWQNRGAAVIIFGIWLVALGSSLVLPFFTIYLRETVGLSAFQVGVALSVRLWTGYGLTMVGGALADRYGARWIMVLGLAVRVGAYVGIASAHSFGPVVAWSMLMGAGGALYIPASKAALAALAGNADRVRLFSMRNTANNLGVAMGPLLGMGAILANPAVLFYIAAASYGAFAVLTALLVAPSVIDQTTRPKFTLRLVTWLAFDWRMILLESISGLFMFLYMQMELTMPLYAKDSFGTWAVSMLFTVNALTVVTLQVPISTWLSRRYSMSVNVAAALGCMALGLLLVGLSHGPAVFLAAVFLFTMGEVIIDPQVDATVSDIVPRGTVGTALGIMGGVSALGGSLGNMVGGPVYARMVELNAGHQFWVWLGFAAVVAALTVLLVGLNMEVPAEEDEA